MGVAALIFVGVLVVVGVGFMLRRRTPRSDDGVASFQRHLGALSPEARRQSIDRVTKPKDSRGGG